MVCSIPNDVCCLRVELKWYQYGGLSFLFARCVIFHPLAFYSFMLGVSWLTLENNTYLVFIILVIIWAVSSIQIHYLTHWYTGPLRVCVCVFYFFGLFPCFWITWILMFSQYDEYSSDLSFEEAALPSCLVDLVSEVVFPKGTGFSAQRLTRDSGWLGPGLPKPHWKTLLNGGPWLLPSGDKQSQKMLLTVLSPQPWELEAINWGVCPLLSVSQCVCV